MNEEKYVVPTATMTEHPEAYELVFEIPGVGKGEADLHVENRSLMLKTHAQYQAPAGFKPVATEFERVNYAIRSSSSSSLELNPKFTIFSPARNPQMRTEGKMRTEGTKRKRTDPVGSVLSIFSSSLMGYMSVR